MRLWEPCRDEGSSFNRLRQLLLQPFPVFPVRLRLLSDASCPLSLPPGPFPCLYSSEVTRVPDKSPDGSGVTQRGGGQSGKGHVSSLLPAS